MRWFARTEQILGPRGYARLGEARVAIFGLGGVGGFACEALARAGVGHLRLVDHDTVSPSNLNRQVLALRSTLGRPKAEVARERVLDINPDCQVDARRDFFNHATLETLLEGPLDVVVDAIDSLNAKTALIQACKERGLAVVSSMGAGGCLDGSLVQSGDLFESRHCRLAQVVRQRLRRRGIASGVRSVWSLELDRVRRAPDPRDVEAHTGPGRARVPLGTIAYMPALFGLRIAEEVIRLLLEGVEAEEGMDLLTGEGEEGEEG